MAEEKAEELKFPLEWDRCHHCGSKLVAATILEEEKKKGKISPERRTAMGYVEISVADPLLFVKQISAPTLTGYFDICSVCGALQAVKVDKKIDEFKMAQDPNKKPKPRSPFSLS